MMPLWLQPKPPTQITLLTKPNCPGNTFVYSWKGGLTMRFYIKMVDKLNVVLRVVVIAFFMIMFMTTFLQVIARNLALFSIPWSDELCRFLIIYVVYLGSGLAARKGRLIRMEVLPMLAKASKKGLHYFYWVAAFFSLGFCIMASYCSVMAMRVNYKAFSAALKIPMAVPYMAIPLGCIFIALNIFANVIELKLEDDKESEEGKA